LNRSHSEIFNACPLFLADGIKLHHAFYA